MAVKSIRRRKDQTKRRRGRVCGLRCYRTSRSVRRRPQKGAGNAVAEQAPTPPNFTFEVTWPSGAEATEEGASSTVAATHDEPNVSWTPIPGTLFTLMVWDPDAAPEASAWLHWLVTNIEGATPSSGTSVVPWAPPTPPAGTGVHRYIFGLFQQEGPLSVRVADRPLFNPKRFAELNGLRSIGYRTTQVSHGLRTKTRSA